MTPVIKTLRYNGMQFAYTSNHHLLGLAEVCLLDIYHCSALPPGGLVIDCGAGIGDYTVLASKRVSSRGLVLAIEPDPVDFQLLEQNVAANMCSNVLPVNVGIGSHRGKRRLTYFGREMSFDVRTLEDVIADPTCERFRSNPIAAVKLDIEGFEGEVVAASLGLFERVERVPIELHGTQPIVDRTLSPLGFRFFPLGRRQARRRLLLSVLRHPITASRIYLATREYQAHTILELLGGQLTIAEGNDLQVGEYVR